VKVAKLVCAAFCGPRPSLRHWALHRNGDRLDDRAANLYWGTPAQNVADARRHGTFNPYGGRKVTPDQVQAIRLDRRPACQVAADFGISRFSVHDIRQRRSWRHLPERLPQAA
jgi:hypothetical protein